MAVNGEARRPSRTQRALSFGQRQVDRVVSPQSRQKSYDAAIQFATEKPILSAFIVSQILFSTLPLGLFITFSLSTAAFALVSAVVFSFFWIGVALLVLVPVLFVTFTVAVLVFFWAVATFLVGRWVYRNLPVSVQGDMRVHAPSGKQVIFQKRPTNGVNIDFDNVNVKEEAAEIKE